MSQEFLAHAFEPFSQEDASARTAYMGTGLGLPIAKQLVEMMGGSIEVESHQNVGTTFTTTIPFEIDTEYRADADSEDADMELDVTKAYNGQEAVDIFAASKNNHFDLILMDVMMPVMDGLTAARTIRAMDREDAASIPIFAMTANAFTDDIEASRQAGMNEHLSKPLNEANMMNEIRRYMAGKKSE